MADIQNSMPKNQEQMQAEQDAAVTESLGIIKNKILVMSGKGGVGKTSTSVNLSIALANKGYKVGIMDVDLHGPDVPRMLGLEGAPEVNQNRKLNPLSYSDNLKAISIESFTPNKDDAIIWRGPLKFSAIKQFIGEVDWQDLDFLIIDSPPGTGDEPLTVAQTISDAKALIVTTPQEVSLADVRKSINFCRQVKMEILGLVENMSGLTCPYCGKIIDVFKARGGQETALKENLRLLATLPLELEVVKEGDVGDISLLDKKELLITQEFDKMVDEIVNLTNKSSASPVNLKSTLEG